MPVRVLCLAGSLRAGSWNRKLISFAAGKVTAAAAEVTIAEPRFFDLPIYDADVEAAGIPAAVEAHKELVRAHHALLIATPEYNHGVPGGLKNWIDWLSRPPPVQPFAGKVVGLMGASTAAGGAIRAMQALRVSFAPLGAWVLPQVVSIPMVPAGWGAGDDPADPRIGEQVTRVVSGLIDMAIRLA